MFNFIYLIIVIEINKNNCNDIFFYFFKVIFCLYVKGLKRNEVVIFFLIF